MKKDWEIKTLQDVCTMKITDGTHQTPKYCNEDEGGFPFISAKNVTKGIIDWDDIKYIVPELHEELYKRIAPQRDDILLAKNGTTGVAAIVDVDKIFDIYVTLAVLRPNKKLIYPKYLLYIVNSNYCKVQFDAHLKGIGVPNLHLVEIQQVHIPVPPLEEQKRIVKILDEKFAQLETIKANTQTNLQNAKDLFQSQLTKAFSNTTWEKKRLGDSSELITKGSSPKWQGINYVTNDGILFVTSENVRENYIDLEKSKYLEKKFNEKQKRSILKKNDVLVNIVGASIGRAAIFEFDIEDANINQAVALIRTKSEIDVHFLSHFLNSDIAMNQYNNAKKDTARANLSLDDINNLRIPLPPLPEQKRIVEELDTLSEKVRQLQEIYTKQIANCEELKQSLLKKAFEGEL